MMALLLTLAQAAAGIGAGEAPPPPASTCDAPVLMVIEGRTLDRARMGQYAAAIAKSEIYQKLGGYYVNVPRPIEVFEGEVEPDYVNLTVRFPCIENARAFWNSRVYQDEIIDIRRKPTSAGDYTVTIYAEAPLREDMTGKVGDARFTYDFSNPDVPQVDNPVVGPEARGDSE
ncbi:MAG: DUF1330 domain-containing protein [Pseudomonadota bacterium]